MMNMFYDVLSSALATALENKDANVNVKINGKDVDMSNLVKSFEKFATEYASEIEKTPTDKCPNCDSNPCTCGTEPCKHSVEPEPKEMFHTTYSAPNMKLDDGTIVCKPKSADEMLPCEDVEEESLFDEITRDVDKVVDAEIYFCKPFVAGVESADDPIIIPFQSYTKGKAITGITDEQLVAILASRYRNDDERFKIVTELIQTYYGK